jgi:glycosyltransferase involved in cell wall biosynthesis
MKISIVVSVYNEASCLEEMHELLSSTLYALPHEHEIIYVNDGSLDKSQSIIDSICSTNPHSRGICFSRNFGHESAMIAGIDHATGDMIVCLDADLQHPPKCIPEIVNRYLGGDEIVLMVREETQGVSRWKTLSATIYYKILNKLSSFQFQENASDFFMISGRVGKILVSEYRERNRFLRGFVQLVGYRQSIIRYVAEERFAGQSKYSFLKLLKFSLNTLVNFSHVPLRLSIVAAAIVGIISVLLTVYSIIQYFLGNPPPGYTTLISVVTFLFSIQFSFMGIMGMYIAKIYAEIKGRPIYLIEKKLNF